MHLEKPTALVRLVLSNFASVSPYQVPMSHHCLGRRGHHPGWALGSNKLCIINIVWSKHMFSGETKDTVVLSESMSQRLHAFLTW